MVNLDGFCTNIIIAMQYFVIFPEEDGYFGYKQLHH